MGRERVSVSIRKCGELPRDEAVPDGPDLHQRTIDWSRELGRIQDFWKRTREGVSCVFGRGVPSGSTVQG